MGNKRNPGRKGIIALMIVFILTVAAICAGGYLLYKNTMDMRMPVMDGITATREIRKLTRPDAKTIPIIALTANAFEEDVKQCMEAGMDAHLSKPVDMDLLKETLGRLLM